MNITLLELLRQDQGIAITGLDPLPTDEKGVDMPLVFSTVRQAIMSKKRWDIEELAFLGQFSFNRFIMWNDIRNRADELAKNKVVELGADTIKLGIIEDSWIIKNFYEWHGFKHIGTQKFEHLPFTCGYMMWRAK